MTTLPGDFSVTFDGSIALLHLHTPAAGVWAVENISDLEDVTMWGSDGALVVEPRHVGDIVFGMEEAGLTLFLNSWRY